MGVPQVMVCWALFHGKSENPRKKMDDDLGDTPMTQETTMSIFIGTNPLTYTGAA